MKDFSEVICCSQARFYAGWAKETPEAELMRLLNILISDLDNIDFLAATLGLLQQQTQQLSVSSVATSRYQCSDVELLPNASNSDMGISFVLPQAAAQRPLICDRKEEDLAVIWLVHWHKAHEQLFISRVFLGNSEHIPPFMKM